MISRLALFTLVTIFLVGCQGVLGDLFGPADLPTRIASAPTVTPPPTATNTPDEPAGQTPVPPTWTAEPPAADATPTTANFPTITPPPTHTPFSTFTPTQPPTDTPTVTPETTPTDVATPTSTATTPPDYGGANWLPNPSFEQGWYHPGGYAEVQVPNSWTFGWKEGNNPLDSDPWNRYVRPESRQLNGDFLPADELDLFIWDGDYTMKVFKGGGALYFWLVTNVHLEPGSYMFTINVFPDLVEGYSESGGKIWASDPLSGEVRFIVDDEVDNWILPKFGQKNTLDYAFGITEARNVRLGVAFRGRWAIDNNGWFMDDWSLVQFAPPEQPLVDQP